MIFSSDKDYAFLDFRKSFFLDRYKLIEDDTEYFSKNEKTIHYLTENAKYINSMDFKLDHDHFKIKNKKEINPKYKQFFWMSLLTIFLIFIIDNYRKEKV